jgi:hypothetical protein
MMPYKEWVIRVDRQRRRPPKRLAPDVGTKLLLTTVTPEGQRFRSANPPSESVNVDCISAIYRFPFSFTGSN